MPPTRANGKICYVEIPATDIHRSASFYQEVFGWRIRQRTDGHVAFDDTTGEGSGTWTIGRPPSREPGLLLYIMVDSVAATADAVVALGCEIVQPIGAGARDHRQVPRSRWKRDWPLPGARQLVTCREAGICWLTRRPGSNGPTEARVQARHRRPI